MKKFAATYAGSNRFAGRVKHALIHEIDNKLRFNYLFKPQKQPCGAEVFGAKKIVLVALGSLLINLVPVLPAVAQTSTNPWDWIIQHICADASDSPVAVDPYGGCPAGTRDRRLTLNDQLPYWKHDQPTAKSSDGAQRHDSHPLPDRQFGGSISANDFDFMHQTAWRITDMTSTAYKMATCRRAPRETPPAIGRASSARLACRGAAACFSPNHSFFS